MAGAAALPQPFDQAAQRGGAHDLAIGNGRGDARQVLHHQPAGADIEMSDLGVAHLAGRQADVLARRVQEGVRAGRPQAVEAGRAGLADRVVGRLLAPAPTVQHHQHHRPTRLHSCILCCLTPCFMTVVWD
jgi:hypothetical protein